MRGLLLCAILAGGLLPTQLAAQRGSTMRGEAHFSGNTGFQSWGTRFPAFGPVNPGLTGHGMHAWRSEYRDNVPFWGSPYLYGGDYPSYGDGNQVEPPGIMVVMPQFPTFSPPPPPPPPIRSETHEYQWPDSGGGNASATAFTIVSRDGRVESAIAVWVQNKVVFYVAPDGSRRHMQIDLVDQEATRRQNAAKKLTLTLSSTS